MCSEIGRLHREKIKQTVEQVVPQVEIDTTKVLTPEESEIIRRQTEERIVAQRLAVEHGRNKLRELVKMTAERAVEMATERLLK